MWTGLWKKLSAIDLTIIRGIGGGSRYKSVVVCVFISSMFGGVAVPSNSTHLRKSGSRPVVYDLDEHEVENGVEEGLLHAVEADDSKGSVTAVGGATMMPSPALLWRFKVLLFLVWAFICCKIGWDSVMIMSADKRDLFLYEAFLYFNPLLLASATLWMHGFTPLHSHLLYDVFYLFAIFQALMVWLWGINLWFFAQGGVNYAKIFDLDQNHLTHREIWKVATIAWLEADSVCGSHSVAIPLVLVLPYLFRLNQCLRQYKDTGEKTSLLNALKYSTAVPVIFLSALKYHVFPDKWTNFYRPLWLLSGVVNSSYSFYWDVNRDWDLGGLHIQVYFWVIGSNLILRCTWTYKLSAHLRHNYLTVFIIAALEIFRRFQWIFFRVENEWNKMNSKSHSHLSAKEIPNDEENLLHSINYSV
ncbi:hypothetical protein V8G54_025753 [Vigna mungo]|uniref:EXS domain-containing protein n=1 Tax=Vigna mungo TaxID=3915 RepID=A0AAQ3MYW8_VIGMU